MRYIKFIFSTIATVAIVIVLDIRIASLPPLGEFFSPFHGFWRNGLIEKTEKKEMRLHGLRSVVHVLWDDRMVPHIFADNDYDLYFAQGYITAKDRLWQMDFQTYIAGGRLSEIFGEKTLEFDMLQRRLGMLEAAKKSVDTFSGPPESKETLNAYVAGVNAYIQSLSPRDYPLEYKILDYKPELWSPLKCALLLKYMSWRLCYSDVDLPMTRLLKKLGNEDMADLFPPYPEDISPVIPKGTLWNFQPVPLQMPKTQFLPKYLDMDIIQGPGILEELNSGGSNNWAVSGKKTASGCPILASDPHLYLTLPAVWYEIQLVSPSVNVYGVSLPGAPCVSIGFNEKIAWGVTNAESDVCDWYEIQFKDEKREEYLHGGEWKKIRRVNEEIIVRGSKNIIDTVLYTHHGPIVLLPDEKMFRGRIPIQASLKWTGHENGNELLALWKLSRAQNYQEFVTAISHYDCPAQNFAFASADGDISMWHNGKFPAKWYGQGRFICDGSDPCYDWQSWIQRDQNPHIKNPEQGFVCSANQQPTDASYPYFLSGFYEFYRNVRIGERLTEMKNIVPDDFRKLQNDTKNLHAASILPYLLGLLEEQKSSDSGESVMIQELKNWDFFNNADKIAPSIFAEWWKRLSQAVWEDELGPQSYARYPSRHRTAEIMRQNPNAKWFDDIRTKQVETLKDLANKTFVSTYQYLTQKYGPFGKDWAWGKYQDTKISHLARIPGLGCKDLFLNGASSCINATTRNSGPSWRMVVALGKEVKAWGIYPGGQSGNPGSPHYDDFLPIWIRGELSELLYLRSPKDVQNRIVCTWQLVAYE